MSEFRSVFVNKFSLLFAVTAFTFLSPGCDDLSLPGTGSSTPPPKPSQSFSLHAGQQEGMGMTTLYQAADGGQTFQISNLRKLPNDRFEIDWRRTGDAEVFDSGFSSLVIRFPSQDSPVKISLHIWNNQDSGKISGHLISFNFGGPKQEGHALDRGCEILIARVVGFDAYKLSNSITVGGASQLTPKTPPAKPKPSKTNNPSAEKTNQFAQQEPAEKEPVPETELSPLPASLRLKEGLYLYAQLSGNWIPIKVIKIEAGEKVKVHWLGFNDAWDTTLERNKLRVKTSELELLSQKP
jgi:hypothetical protein